MEGDQRELSLYIVMHSKAKWDKVLTQEKASLRPASTPGASITMIQVIRPALVLVHHVHHALRFVPSERHDAPV